MVAAYALPGKGEPREQRMLLHGVSWKDYVIVRELLDGPGLRMTYIRGALELMSPSPEHELWKKNIARFVEHFAWVKDVPLHGYGSTTFKKEVEERGAEPDECYLVGKKLGAYPEIVIEVIYSAPLLDKLEVYRPMGIPEVWVFEQGAFRIWVLDQGKYRQQPRSALIPALDFEMLARYAVREDTPQALREFDAEIRR